MLNGAGETVYFIKPDGSRVLDAVQFGPQANGVSYGRWPDGANDFYAFTTNTPGANNSSIVIGDIVINELMYDPITENDDDQYIELYNQGTNAINLAGWQFTAGVSFTFPSITIAPNSYVVVAEKHDQPVRQIYQSEQWKHGGQLQWQTVAQWRTGDLVQPANPVQLGPFWWKKIR